MRILLVFFLELLLYLANYHWNLLRFTLYIRCLIQHILVFVLGLWASEENLTMRSLFHVIFILAGASFVTRVLISSCLHLGRAISYGGILPISPNTWFSGIIQIHNLLNGYSISWVMSYKMLGQMSFLGCYSNYKFIISFSIFNRMGFWRTLCLRFHFCTSDKS